MPDAAEELRRLLSDEEPNYQAALVIARTDMTALQALVAEPDPFVAANAVYLAGLIDDPVSGNIVREAAGSGEDVIRVGAAAAAGNLATPDAVAPLRALLEDPQAAVRKVALESSAKLPGPELRSDVEALSRTDSEPAIREVSRRVLREMQG